MRIIAFFGSHVPVSPVQMCGFEGNNLADLRGDFRIFADTKHQELPGASASGKHRSEAHKEGGEEQHLNRKGSEQQRVQTGVIICSLVVDPWWVLDTHQ